MKAILILAIICIIHFGFSQSLEGNFNTKVDGVTVVLKYGNVDIFNTKNELVKSVITDELGNFSTKLDTGTYKCIVNYAGFEPIERMVIVNSDEKMDFIAAESEKGTSMLRLEETKKKRSVSTGAEIKSTFSSEEEISITSTREKGGAGKRFAYGYSAPPSGIISMDDDSIGVERVDDIVLNNRSEVKALTATEVNDFAKWSLWQGYEKDTLYAQYLNMFKIQPSGRYTLQLQNKEYLPISNALVSLYENNNLVFKSRTDNTGKAELWVSMRKKLISEIGKTSIKVEYKGKIVEIKNAKAFEFGINHLTIDEPCDQNQIVDIAFVFDATGSMGDELNFLQNEMKDIIFNSKKLSEQLQYRFANVFYKDEFDSYLTKKQDFTNVLTEAGNFIAEQSAGGGGDEPEAVEDALEVAVDSLSWAVDSRAKLLFLILDAPPHLDEKRINRIHAIVRKAAEKGIRIIPIGASGIKKPTEFLLRSIALTTNGTYTALTDHSGIGGAHLIPTTDKYDVETLNEMIVRIIQTMTVMPDCQEQVPQVNLNFPDSLVQFPEPNSIDSLDSLGRTHTLPIKDSIPIEIEVSWSFYPNPTDGILNVLSSQDIKEIFVSDMTGKELMMVDNIEANRPRQIDLTAYPTGIYLIRYLNKENKWISGKVVLSRF